MANPEISSTNGASIFINFCSFSFKTIYFLGKKGINLFKRLKHDTLKFTMPSNSNIFLMPKTKSSFSCISITIGMINNTLMNCPFPTWILYILGANFGNECKDLYHK